MVAARAFEPVVECESQSEAAAARRAPAWTPDSRAELIYQMVKFEGLSQREAAHSFGLSQATVSRIVNRYERWRTRGGAGRVTGELTPAERMRVQRWLTYERNELLLAHALRVAGQLERQGSQHTNRIRTQISNGEQERVIENVSFDQSGAVARFLRLAFRINMEQLKLVENEPLPDLPPLTDSELEEEAEQAEAIAADFAEQKRRSAEWERQETERAAATVGEVRRGGKQQEPGRREEGCVADCDSSAALATLDKGVGDESAEERDLMTEQSAARPADESESLRLYPVHQVNHYESDLSPLGACAFQSSGLP